MSLKRRDIGEQLCWTLVCGSKQKIPLSLDRVAEYSNCKYIPGSTAVHWMVFWCGHVENVAMGPVCRTPVSILSHLILY